MAVKQISVFLETTTDGLMQFTKVLQENNIDIRAFSIAEAPSSNVAVNPAVAFSAQRLYAPASVCGM